MNVRQAQSDYVEFDEYGRLNAAHFDASQDFAKNEFFYAVVQAACYIMCFYGTELASSRRMSERVGDMWRTVLSSPLDPLRYCLKSVQTEFVKLALYTGLLATHTLRASAVAVHLKQVDSDVVSALGLTEALNLKQPTKFFDDTHSVSGRTDSSQSVAQSAVDQTNKRNSERCVAKEIVRLHESRGTSIVATKANPLDSYFPFDPCMLAKLHKHIDKHYRPWNGVPGLPKGDKNQCNASNFSEGSDEDDQDSDRSDIEEESVAMSLASKASSYAGSAINSFALESHNHNPFVTKQLGSEYHQYQVGSHTSIMSMSYPSLSSASSSIAGMNQYEGVISLTDQHDLAAVAGRAAVYDNQLPDESKSDWPERDPHRGRQYSVGSTGSW